MKVQKLVRAALIAAVYVTLCLVLQPISYGPVQVRVAEALTLLPLLCPEAVVGVTLGCFIANLFSGVPLDVIVGTLATLLAALATRKLRKVRLRNLPLLAAAPPVLFNALMVGAELTFLYFPAGSGVGIWLYNMLTVGVGQLVSCYLLGVPLVWFIERTPALHRLFTTGGVKNQS